MRQVLLEDTEYPYLQHRAKERLDAARHQAKLEALGTRNIISLTDGSCCILPWMGTVAFRTLERLINYWVREALDIKSISGQSPYYLTVKLGKSAVQELEDKIVEFCSKGLTEEDLVAVSEAPKLQKYDHFIPNNLLRKAYASDYLDMEELTSLIQHW